MHAVEAAIAGAGDPADRIHAGRRRRVRVAQTAGRLVAQDGAHIHVLHLVAHVDVEPVHRQVQPHRRRPHEASAPRGAGFRIQPAVALAGADQVLFVVRAVIATVHRAGVIVVGTGFVVARAGIHVMQVRRAEGGAVGAAHQQGLDRAPFQATAPGRLADRVARVAVLVEAAGHAEVERVVQRQAQLGGGRPAVAAAVAVRVFPAVVVVLRRQRVRIQRVGLVAELGRRREAGLAARQLEQLAVGQGQRGGIGARLRRIGGARGDRVVLAAAQRPVQARRVGVEHREHVVIVIGVLAQLLAQEQGIGPGGDDLRPADAGLVLRVAQRGLVFPVRAERALEASGHAEGLLRAAHHAVVEPAHFFRGELALPELHLVGGLVVEVAVLVAIGGHAAPLGHIAHQRQVVVAHLHIGEPFGAIVEGIAQRGVAVGAAALAEDGAVADRPVAAAVEAVARTLGVPGAAVVLAGQRIAGGLARIEVVVVVVGAQVGAARGAGALGGRVEGGILLAALIRPQRRLRLQFQAVDRAETARIETAGDAHVEGLTATFAGGAHAHVHRGAIDLLLQDEVDHPGDRVRAVDRRGAAGQHFDALDHPDRDVGDIGEVAAALERHREIGDAAAVDQHQRVVGAEAAQVDLLRAGREISAAGGLLALGLTAVLGHRPQHVGHAGEAAGLDLLGGDDGHGRRPFYLRAWNARAGDLHRIQLLHPGGGRLGTRGRGHTHQRQLDRPRHRLFTHENSREESVGLEGGLSPIHISRMDGAHLTPFLRG